MLKAWKAFSTLLIACLAALPLLTIAFGLPWPAAVVAAVFFWPGMLQVICLAVKHRELPCIVQGPTFSWAGRSYGLRR